jgi:hypothetical protein
VLILTLLASGSPAPAASTVEVRSPSAKLIDTSPGRILTFSAVVANRGDQPDEFVEQLRLPTGCQKVAPPDLPFGIAPGGQVIRVMAVAIPSTMPAGRFDISYLVHSRRDPSSIGSLDLAMHVGAVDDLALVVDPHLGPVLAGDSYAVKLRVINRGNTPVEVQLASRSSAGFPVTMADASFHLPAGSTREMSATVQTDHAFERHSSHAVTFDGTATTATGKSLVVSQASVVEVIPLISGNRDIFHRLPVNVRLTGIAEAGYDARFQAEINGNGSLDEAGEHQVDFLLRGPDAQGSSLFGERDEYGASYRGEHWDFDLGDRIYSLSPLTQKHSLGRGAGVAWHDEDTTAGAYYMSTRYRQQNSEEFGAYLREDFTENFSMQANVMRKLDDTYASAWSQRQNIVTLETHHRFKKALDLRLEAGISRSDDGTTDAAYHVDAEGELPGKVHYAIEHTHAGPNFRGYYWNTDTTYLSVTKEFSPKWRGHANLNRYAESPNLVDVRSSVINKENSWNLGADYAVTKDAELSLEWQHVDREDLLLPAAYNFTEDSARLGAGYNWGKFQSKSYVAHGFLDNSITGESGPFNRYTTVVSWSPDDAQTYSVFANHGPSAFSGSSDESLNAGASARWKFNQRLSANVSYARNQYDGLTGHEQDQALASLQYEFKNKSILALMGRWLRGVSKVAASEATNEAAVLVTYSIPFHVPVSRKRSIGTLEGRLVDGNGAGVPRVVVQAGSQFAVTDPNGRFEFPSLKPGPCQVKVIPDSLGPLMAMTTPLPMNVTVDPGETTSIELNACPASTISVSVKRFEFADGTALTTSGEVREARGEDAAIVEISNGRDTLRAQTDRLGAATFDRLPEGRWTLRVAVDDPSSLYTVEDAERTLTLVPGASQNVVVRVLPQKRSLRMLDQGTIR